MLFCSSLIPQVGFEFMSTKKEDKHIRGINPQRRPNIQTPRTALTIPRIAHIDVSRLLSPIDGELKGVLRAICLF